MCKTRAYYKEQMKVGMSYHIYIYTYVGIMILYKV